MTSREQDAAPPPPDSHPAPGSSQQDAVLGSCKTQRKQTESALNSKTSPADAVEFTMTSSHQSPLVLLN